MAAISAAIEQIAKPRSIDQLRLLESQAALDYWGAWQDLDVVFVQRDYDRVPEHWRTFGVRRSLITGNPRKATNPANAILNYLFSILEAEARIAALKDRTRSRPRRYARGFEGAKLARLRFDGSGSSGR